MKSYKMFVSAVFALSSVACLFSQASLAQVIVGTYDFTVQGAATGMTRDVALNAAIADARGKCGYGNAFVGYDHIRYVPDFGSTWAYLDGYCKRHGMAELDKNDGDADRKAIARASENFKPEVAARVLGSQQSAK